MRGEHYCIALALLIDGVPQLSALACPNLSMERVLRLAHSDDDDDDDAVRNYDVDGDVNGGVGFIEPAFQCTYHCDGSGNGLTNGDDDDVDVDASHDRYTSVARDEGGGYVRTLHVADPRSGSMFTAVSGCPHHVVRPMTYECMRVYLHLIDL